MLDVKMQIVNSHVGNSEFIKREREVVVLGFLQRGRCNNRHLEVLWQNICNSVTAQPRDLLIVLVLSRFLPPINSEIDGEFQDADIKGAILSSLGKEGKRIVKQLRLLKQLCNQREMEMVIKYVTGEAPEEALVEQATTCHATLLVVSISHGFVAGRIMRLSNYLGQHVPAGCSVVIIRNGKVVCCPKVYKIQDKHICSQNCEQCFPSQIIQFQFKTYSILQSKSLSKNNAMSCIEQENVNKEEARVMLNEFVDSSVSENLKDKRVSDEHPARSSSSGIIQVYFNLDEEDHECGKFLKQETRDSQMGSDSSIHQVYFETREESNVGFSGSYKKKDGGSSHSFKLPFEQSSSPRGVLDVYSALSPSEISSTNDSFSSRSLKVSNVNSSVRLRWHNLLRLWKQRSMQRMTSFPPAGSPRSRKRVDENKYFKRSTSLNENEKASCFHSNSLPADRGTPSPFSKPNWRCFTLRELEEATSNFRPDNLIGRGGYAEVYKGSLPDGMMVAVKRLNGSKTEEQQIGDFLSELGIIAHIDHPNAARLVGFCIEGGLHLILQYFSHGSLAFMLYGPNSSVLDWNTRFRIAVGIAKGLHYLHDGCHRRIIHRDIKASNVLLAKNFEPQISDFGLAKWLPNQCSHLTVFPVEGTFGYLAPEYFMYGIVDERTDVFAFGVLLLELITGHPPIDSSQQSLIMLARPLINSKNVKELADPSLGNAYDFQQMTRLVSVAGLCIQQSAHLRPYMGQVLKLLIGDMEPPDLRKVTFSPSEYLDSTDKDEYTYTAYLKDIDRHKEVALEVPPSK